MTDSLPSMPATLLQSYSDIVEFSSGSHGILYKAKQNGTERSVVLKKISKSIPYRRTRLEIEAGSRLRGIQGIPHFHGHFEDSENTWLAIDRAEGHDLLTWMEAGDFKPIPEKTVKHIATHIIRILHRVHHHGFAHKDIKLENIIYDDKTRHVSLIDFGLCFNMKKEQICRDFAGSKEYASPEMLLSRASFCPNKVDVWALGVTLYALLFGMFPFPTDAKSEERMMKSRRHPIVRFPLRDKVSAEAKDLLTKMICNDAASRIEADQLIHHPWLQCNKTKAHGNRNISPVVSIASEREV